MLLYQKSYLCKILSLLYDSNGSKPHIYVLFFKTCPGATHIYIFYWPTPKFIEYQFFGQFLKFSDLLSQFSSDMSGLRTGHVQVWGFILNIRGLGTTSNPNHAKPLFSLSLAAAKAFPRRFQSYSTESLRCLGDLTPLLLRIFKD
jgi:hypothetical protein